jgi:hypothetical protein
MPIYLLSPSTILVVEVIIKLKNMIDDKKIEAAKEEIYKDKFLGCGEMVEAFENEDEKEMFDKEDIKEAIGLGVKWMQEKFLKDLWHPMQEEPKLVGEEIIIEEFLEGKRYTMVQKYMVGIKFLDTIETIRWISNWDSFLSEICDDVKMIRWCYFKDLLPKEGGEQ